MTEMRLEMFCRPCPECGGPVYRDLRWWEQVLFFLPVHFIVKAHHCCMRCGARFVSGPSAADAALSILFIGAHYFLFGYLWVITPVFLGIWLLMTMFFVRGPLQLFVASQLLAALWFIAIVMNGLFPWMFNVKIDRTPIGFILLMVASLLFGYLLLLMDKVLGSRLKRIPGPR